MTCEEKPKRRRIIILSGDESIINEIKNSKHAALCRSVILESQDEEMDISDSHVRKRITLFLSSEKQSLCLLDLHSLTYPEEAKG